MGWKVAQRSIRVWSRKPKEIHYVQLQVLLDEDAMPSTVHLAKLLNVHNWNDKCIRCIYSRLLGNRLSIYSATVIYHNESTLDSQDRYITNKSRSGNEKNIISVLGWVVSINPDLFTRSRTHRLPILSIPPTHPHWPIFTEAKVLHCTDVSNHPNLSQFWNDRC